MGTERSDDEAEIRRRIDRFVEAVRAADIEGVKPVYAVDLVSFDIVPPLRHLGAKAKLRNWAEMFAAYRHPLGYEIRDVTIVAGDNVAFGHSLNRISGTLQSGKQTDYWVRWTTCWQKVGDNWLIAHDQASVPIDVESGRALLHLAP